MNRGATILVGLDASPRAPRVLAAAVDLARAFEAKVVLLRVVGLPVELPREALTISPNDLPAMLEKQATRELEGLAKTVPPALFGGIHVCEGAAWRVITDEAASRLAELIVVGSHGYGGLDRLLGTTAARVVDHARCSTLVVR